MYLEIVLADFAVFCVFLGISRDFAEIPEFHGSATARNIRSPAKSACGATIITHSFVSYVSCCQSRVLRNKYHGFIIPFKELSFSVSSWYSCDFLQETFQRTLIQLRETYHAGCGSFWICQNCRSTQYSSCEEMWSFHSAQDCNGASLKKTGLYKII